jgi:hypothetical protein
MKKLMQWFRNRFEKKPKKKSRINTRELIGVEKQGISLCLRTLARFGVTSSQEISLLKSALKQQANGEFEFDLQFPRVAPLVARLGDNLLPVKNTIRDIQVHEENIGKLNNE